MTRYTILYKDINITNGYCDDTYECEEWTGPESELEAHIDVMRDFGCYDIHVMDEDWVCPTTTDEYGMLIVEAGALL